MIMGRTKGATDIPPRKKAQILAKKNSRQFSRIEIAADAGVAVRTVQNITNESVSLEVLQMAEEYERDLLTYAKANAMKAHKRTFDTIDELNAKDAAVVAEKNFNMAQIIQNKPTVIAQSSPEELARQMFAYLMKELKNELENGEITPEDAAEEVYEHYPEARELKLLGDSSV